MPNQGLVFEITGIAVQYGIVLFIYYFLYRVLRCVAADFRSGSTRRTPAEKKAKLPRRTSAALTVVSETDNSLERSRYQLEETLTIGRSRHNDIVIEDSFVSGEHATINRNKDGCWLTDLNSTNKTFLNDKTVENSILLQNGDIIKIGGVTFRFEE